MSVSGCQSLFRKREPSLRHRAVTCAQKEKRSLATHSQTRALHDQLPRNPEKTHASTEGRPDTPFTDNSCFTPPP